MCMLTRRQKNMECTHTHTLILCKSNKINKHTLNTLQFNNTKSGQIKKIKKEICFILV